MQAALRETGSVLVRAPRERVYALLRRELEGTPGLHEAPPGRIEAGGSTFVLRDEAGGTRLIHARARTGAHLLLGGARPRDALRAQVEADLLRVRLLAEKE